jgi:hypothetical protein
MLLDHLEATGTTLTTRGVLEIVVRPLARQLHTPEGRRYFRIGAQLINHPRFMTDAGEAVTVNTSIARCAAYILPSLDHLPAPVVAERTSQVIGFIIRACGDQARLMDSDPPPRPVLSVEDFTVNLVDTIMAIIQAPTSIAAPPAAPGGLRRPVETARKGPWACSFPSSRIYGGSVGSVGRTVRPRDMWWGFSRWPGNCSLTIRSRLGPTGW